MSKIRVALVDPHALLRETLSASLREQHDIEVIWTTHCPNKAHAMLLDDEPDVLLLDVELHMGGAFTLLRKITEAGGQTRVIVLANNDCQALIKQALSLHASGYIAKDDSLDDLVAGIREVAHGRDYCSERTAIRLRIDSSTQTHELPQPYQLQNLTPRQLEVFLHFARGASAKEVARRMHLSVTAMDNHKYRIMRRLGIHDRVELARLAIREGLISP